MLIGPTHRGKDGFLTTQIADKLLAWYDVHRRELPWRVLPEDGKRGVAADPYRVWLSEIMLQQTTVATVKAYFEKFTATWPRLADLAAASEDDVLKAWAGLGYYSRARNLKKCADAVMATHDGAFPQTRDTLQTLPGIGAYTSAAIASIAFNEPVAVVDGNVERVFTRLFAIETPLPQAKALVMQKAQALLDKDRPGDFAQATMDLGATICTPKKPACLHCPLRDQCAALLADPELFPVKAPKRAKPLRRGAVFIAQDIRGAILLEKRVGSGLLAAMTQPPTTGWTSRIDGETTASAAPFAAPWRHAGNIRHVFTHFELDLMVWHVEMDTIDHGADQWLSPPGQLPGEALPTVMKKAIACALPDAFKGA